MKLSKELVKDLLVETKRRHAPHNRLRRGFDLQGKQSPLISNFEKWAGKKKKLYFENERTLISKGIQNFNLNRNVFAKLLASPMRCEKITKLKAPRDTLIQLKLRQAQQPIETKKCDLELLPLPLFSKLHKSSYICNSSNLLEDNIKAAKKWIPIPALLSDMRYYSASDVKIDLANFLPTFLNELQMAIEMRLPQLDDDAAPLQNWDVLVDYDESKNSRGFEIFNHISPEGSSVSLIKFNLSCVADKNWAKNCIKKFKNHASTIILRLPKDKEAIQGFQRLIAFSSN